MNVSELTALTDLLAEDLTVTHDDESGGPPNLAEFLDSARPVDDDRDVLAGIAALARLRNTVDHALARVASTADRMDIAGRKHVRTVGNLLKEMGLAPAVAQRTARLGKSLDSVPEVARGMRDGAVSAEFGDAVVRGLDFVGRRVELAEEVRQKVVHSLMVQTVPSAVETKARAWALRLAPDDLDDTADGVPVAEDMALNEMTLVQNDEGRIVATFDLDVLSGEELNAALDPLCRPVPEPDGTNDKRSAKQRRADAFTHVVRTFLARSERPESGGVLPHVTLIVPICATLDGSPVVTGGPQTGAQPGAPGSAVDIPLADLDREVAHVPSFGFTGPLSVSLAEQVMCDAAVAGALVDGEGVPLNVGYEKRLFPPWLRKSLAIRDGGCAFPNCGVPPSWCDAHHIVRWADGGETSLVNGVLLCRRHHNYVHALGWEVFLGRDRHPWFVPPVDPAHPGAPREPMRSHARRTLTILATAA